MKKTMPLGPVMLDVAGVVLTDEDRRRLLHPLTGGVILFARNFESCAQLDALTAEIHALRDPGLIIAVDHEGGRVQRFRQGFTHLPPMRIFGTIWDRDRDAAASLVSIFRLRRFSMSITATAASSVTAHSMPTPKPLPNWHPQ
jgi:beta-N-acetylhexosaminidase